MSLKLRNSHFVSDIYKDTVLSLFGYHMGFKTLRYSFWTNDLKTFKSCNLSDEFEFI